MERLKLLLMFRLSVMRPHLAPLISLSAELTELVSPSLSLRCSRNKTTFFCLRILSIQSAFVGSGSRDLLSAVLRADVDLDHDDDDDASGPAKGPFTQTKTPTPLIIDEDEDVYGGGGSNTKSGRGGKGTNGGTPSRSNLGEQREDESSHGEDSVTTQRRGRERFLSSATSATGRYPFPGTPTRSRSGIREDPLGMSPLALSFSGRRPFVSITENSSQHHLPNSRSGASNEEVLSAVKRLETTLAGLGNDAKELKDIGERQTRIEELLLSLTREMRS